jgi:hypothetical protein
VKRSPSRSFCRQDDRMRSDTRLGLYSPKWHSGFHVHAGVGAPEDERAFALRLARHCARNPVAMDRLTYAAESDRVTSRSDKADEPTVGVPPGSRCTTKWAESCRSSGRPPR